MPINNQIVGGNFTDLQGAPLALGYLIFQLSQDEQSAVPGQICAGRKIRVDLDNTGNIPASPAVYLFANDALNPANSYYTVRAYTAEGQIVWGPQVQQVLSSPSPFNPSAWVPNSINTGSTPAPTITLKTNGVNNDSQTELNLTGAGSVSIAQSNGTVTITGSGSSGAGLQTVKTTFAASDIHNSGVTKTLVAAPGPNKAAFPVQLFLIYKKGSQAFTSLGARIGTFNTPYDVISGFDITGFADQVTTDNFLFAIGQFFSDIRDPEFDKLSFIENQDMTLNLSSGDSNGDGSVIAVVSYYVVDWS